MSDDTYTVGDQETKRIGGANPKLVIREYIGGTNGRRVFKTVGHVMPSGNFRVGSILPLVSTISSVDGVAGETLNRYVFLDEPSDQFRALCIVPLPKMVQMHCDSCATQHRVNAKHCSANLGLTRSPLERTQMYTVSHDYMFHFSTCAIELELGRVSLVHLQLVNI